MFIDELFFFVSAAFHAERPIVPPRLLAPHNVH